jgi:hypothetical protein
MAGVTKEQEFTRPAGGMVDLMTHADRDDLVTLSMGHKNGAVKSADTGADVKMYA